MLSCKEITEQAGQYLDGEMPFMTRMQFRLHTFICGPCRTYLKRLLLLKSALPTLNRQTNAKPVNDQYVDTIITKANDHE